MRETKRATLILEDGTSFEGKSFGHEASTAGEVVFNTAMTGYPENLTDPSCEGQILVSTYPLLGNYGVPPRGGNADLSEHFESSRIHCRAIIAQDYAWEHSHWLAERSLAQWLKDEKVAGIYGIDTRRLTKHLREHGSMLGKIVFDGKDVDFYDPNKENLVALTSSTEVKEFGPEGGKRVVLVDCGLTHSIIRALVAAGVHVVRVPWDYDFTAETYDGLILSNGPGNPDFAKATIENIRKALEQKIPICGIGMGSHLLGMAAGAKIIKLKYGHRGHNQPVRMVGTNRCYITSQNHGYAIDNNTLPEGWEPLFVNMNDGSNEGIRHKSLPYISAQFQPEACSSPNDRQSYLDEFINKL